MENHTDTFKPPEGSPPTPQENFRSAVNLMHWTFGIAAAPWCMFTRKLGSVGTRAYWMDMVFALPIMLGLTHSIYPYNMLFRVTLIATACMFVLHHLVTFHKKKHVHTHCVGDQILGDVVTPAVGVGIAAVFYYSNLHPYAVFVFVSVIATIFRDAVIAERDRQQIVQFENAMWDQEYMLRNMHRYGKKK